MTVVELHPEDLLDKEACGELSGDERTRLDAHLARCTVCRAERLLRVDFADELSGSERPSAVFGLVQSALAAPRPLQRPAEMTPELAGPGLRRPKRTAIVLLVAAAVLAAGAASATGLTARALLSLRHSQDTLHPTAPVSPVLVPVPALSQPPVSPVLVPVPALSQPPVSPVLVPVPVPSLSLPPSLSPPPSPRSAAHLFDSANAARRAGDTSTALAQYDALDHQFPSSHEARVAKATAGRLLLDRGEAARALARFDAYLASGSSELREEVMAGRATALERLGRDDDESRAWASLLSTYPNTPYAAHARARIGRSLPQ